MKKPRVVHVVVAGEIGGAERMLVSLASASGTSEFEHAIALMTPNDGLVNLFRENGLRVIDRGPVRESPVAYALRSLGPLDVAWLADTLRREKASLVHLHTFGSQVVGARAALELGCPILRTEHSTRVYKDPSCWPFSRWSLGKAHAVVAVSEHIRSVALAKAPWIAPRIRVIHSGVDTRTFTPTDSPLRPIAGPFRFAISGRLEPRKGVDLALQALTLVPGAHLSIVGDGGERGRLESKAMALNVAHRVQFHGYVRDPRNVVRESDVVLCSSREEALGMALLEAMAMGRSVVTVPVGGVPEIVSHGKTGWVARDCSVDALAREMREAMRDRASVILRGKAARTFVETNCSLERMVESYAGVYRMLLGESGFDGMGAVGATDTTRWGGAGKSPTPCAVA